MLLMVMTTTTTTKVSNWRRSPMAYSIHCTYRSIARTIITTIIGHRNSITPSSSSSSSSSSISSSTYH